MTMNQEKKLKVVILESDPVVLDLLKGLLIFKGHNVFVFPDPTICPLFKISHCDCSKDYSCVDVIIADVGMPNMGGIDFFERQMQRGCKIPAGQKLLLGDPVSPEQQAAIAKLGCQYIQKPFNTFEIINWLDECVNISPEGPSLSG